MVVIPIDDGVLMADFIAGAQHALCDTTDQQAGRGNNRKTQPRAHIAVAEKAITEAIDHVEEWVQMARVLPKRGQ